MDASDPLIGALVGILLILNVYAFQVPVSEVPNNLEGTFLIVHQPVKTTSNSALMRRIIECESNWDWKKVNPESGAFGYCQFLPKTWDYVQKKWKRKLDRNNPVHQLYACQRLLDEENWVHWLASKSCWDR